MKIYDKLDGYWGILIEDDFVGWITIFRDEYCFNQAEDIYLNEKDLRGIADQLKKFNEQEDYHLQFLEIPTCLNS